MSLFDQLVILGNALMALVACGVNWWGAKQFHKAMRFMFTFIAISSFGYFLSYIWLIFHGDSVETWSRAVRPLGVLTWTVPWTIMPILMVRSARREARRIIQRAEKTVEAYSFTLPEDLPPSYPKPSYPKLEGNSG